MRPELAVWPLPIAVLADALGDVEHDRHWQDVVPARQRDERLARVLLDVRGIDDGQAAGGEPLAGNEVERLEGVARRRLVVLVIGYESTEVVRAT